MSEHLSLGYLAYAKSLYALHQSRCSTGCLSKHHEPAMFTSVLLSKIRSYLKYRETVRELSRLSDRELEDVGISRFQIDGVAKGYTA
jgi:uncharacterized protein YjiS (DUF1127 family)